ncbi:Phage-related integrase (fragment) [Bartonella clarridgeiae 73]|uniref:Phage-related integrase n=1 Tax=Bartonella clarridgeiae (strain CCUG 45776 / CIP 104772 / 73) TaxID=696125 RepID=E6YH17_BARC7
MDNYEGFKVQFKRDSKAEHWFLIFDIHILLNYFPFLLSGINQMEYIILISNLAI